MEGPTDLDRCKFGKRAALQAAVVCHRDDVQLACTKVANRLKELGVRGVLPQSLVKEARNAACNEIAPRGGVAQQAAENFAEYLRRRASGVLVDNRSATDSDEAATDGNEIPTPLWFHQDEWCKWDKRVWRKLPLYDAAVDLRGILGREVPWIERW